MFQVTESSASVKTVKTEELPCEASKAVKRPADNNDGVSPKDIKRIKPTFVSSNVSKPKKNEDADDDDFVDDTNGHNNNDVNRNKEDEQQLPSSTTNVMENPITESFAKLIEVCR